MATVKRFCRLKTWSWVRDSETAQRDGEVQKVEFPMEVVEITLFNLF
jgi:hypothetical protein